MGVPGVQTCPLPIWAERGPERARADPPAIPPAARANLAVKRSPTPARLSGAVSGATGLPGAVVDVGVLAWTQSRMVLHVAAAYGVDSTHTDRADRKSTRLNSSHANISYAVFCLKKKRSRSRDRAWRAP